MNLNVSAAARLPLPFAYRSEMQSNPYQPPAHVLRTIRQKGRFTTAYVLAAVSGLYASLTWSDGLVAKIGDLLEPHAIAVFAGFGVLALLSSLMCGRLCSDRISTLSQLACRIVGGISLGLLPRQFQKLADYLVTSGLLPSVRGSLALFVTILFVSAISAVGIEYVLRQAVSATRPVALQPPK